MRPAPEAGPGVVRLTAAQVPLATGVLCEAFYDYPALRFFLGGRNGEYDRRLARLVDFFVRARILRQEPLLGIEHGQGLGAVALLSFPGRGESPSELSELREEVWADLGPEARARYEAYGSACEPLLTAEPHIHLNMIGTSREARGRGLGRRLLEHIHRMSDRDASSRGVTLTTEDPSNLTLYKHFGYRLVGSARVWEELETWVFFRPDTP